MPDVLKKSERENLFDDMRNFESWGSDSCSCHTGNPPCGWCTHEGNPQNVAEDEDATMTLEITEKLADTEFLPGDKVYAKDQVNRIAGGEQTSSYIVFSVGVNLECKEFINLKEQSKTYKVSELVHAEDVKAAVIKILTDRVVSISTQKF